MLMDKETQIKSLKEKYSKLIQENRGNLVQTQEWGLLNLSYLIKKNKKGNYIHFKIEGNGDLIKELEKNERIDKNLLRFVTIKVKKLDRTGKEVFQVEYLDAWPKTVSQVDLNHTTTNATLRVTCEFSYSYWRTTT